MTTAEPSAPLRTGWEEGTPSTDSLTSPRCAPWPIGPPTGPRPWGAGCGATRAWFWPTRCRRACSSTSRPCPRSSTRPPRGRSPTSSPPGARSCSPPRTRPPTCARPGWSRSGTRRSWSGPPGARRPSRPGPATVTVAEVRDAAGLDIWDRVLAEGFPAPHSPAPPALLGGPVPVLAGLGGRRTGRDRAVVRRARRRRRRGGGHAARAPAPRRRGRSDLGGNARATRTCPRC